MSGETTAPGLVPRLRGEWAMLTTDEHADVWRLRREAADAIEQHVAEILRLRAELAALREPAGDLVGIAINALLEADGRDRRPWEHYDERARAVLAAVLPRVRAEGCARIAGVVEAARFVRDGLVPGFVRCEFCGEQGDTGDLDGVPELDAALKAHDALPPPSDAAP